MPKKLPKRESPPIPRIIVERLHDHWSAWFEGTPENAFGGDSPGTSVDRLWGAHLEMLDQRGASR